MHERTTEVYLVACGTGEIRVEAETVVLNEGDVIVVEPGVSHTFLSSTPEHFHFALHILCLKGEEAIVDKVVAAWPRSGP